jgi:hypothetical protein
MRHHQQSAATDPNKQQNTFHPLKERKERKRKKTTKQKDCRLSQTPAPICFCLSDICSVCTLAARNQNERFVLDHSEKWLAMTHFPNKRKQHFINLSSCFRNNSNNNEGKKKGSRRARLPDGVGTPSFAPIRASKATSQQQVKGGKKKKPLEIIIIRKKLGCPVLAMRNFPHKTSCVRSLSRHGKC